MEYRKSLSKILLDSRVQRKTFGKVTKSGVYPLSCCGYRWCENKNCLHIAVKIWPAFNTLVNHLMKLPKTNHLAKREGKSFLVLKRQ